MPALFALCAQHPLCSLFVSHRVATFGLGNPLAGITVLGYERDSELVAACYFGNNLIPIGSDPIARAAFVEVIGPRRDTWSIMGERDAVLGIYHALATRWGSPWSCSRQVRAEQPLLMIDHDPLRPGDFRIGEILLNDFDPYFRAAVAMYTEEVGVSPIDQHGTYQRYVRSIIEDRRAYGGIHRGRVWFKADVGVSWQDYCQVQGVWLDPVLRGRGLSEGAMASVVALARRRFPVVSLYVNDYNTRARRLYAALGFRQVGTMATVLY